MWLTVNMVPIRDEWLARETSMDTLGNPNPYSDAKAWARLRPAVFLLFCVYETSKRGVGFTSILVKRWSFSRIGIWDLGVPLLLRPSLGFRCF